MAVKGETLIAVGALRGPHGLKGLVKASVTLDDADLIVTAGPLLTADGRRLTVQDWKTVGQGLLALKLEGIETVAQAESLRGVRIFLDRAAWPEVAGEVYLDTLVGQTVVDEAGTPVGTVRAIVSLPAGPALEIVRDSDGKTALVPVAPDFIVLDTPLRLTALGGDVVRL